MASVATFRFFERDADFTIVERRLPHWSQAGTISFITWRTWDSIPKSVLAAWMDERNAWLARRGIAVADSRWKQRLAALSREEQRDFHERFVSRWEECLDEC